MLKATLLLLLILSVSCQSSVYYTPCAESTTRTCPYGTNTTDRLLNLKKGGQRIVTTNTYDSDFYLC